MLKNKKHHVQNHLGTSGTALATVFLFSATAALAVAAARRIDLDVVVQSAPVSFASFLISFAIAVLVIGFLLRHFRHPRFLRLFFGLVLWQGATVILALVLPSLAATVLALFFVVPILVTDRAWTVNGLLVLGLAGIAGNIATTLPFAAIPAILVVLSLYDIVAVYRTKQMIVFARGLLLADVPVAFILPLSWRDAFRRRLELLQGKRAMLLGTGDIAIPAIFLAAVARAHGAIATLVVWVGGMAGLLFLAMLFSRQKQPRPMPGLPPIVAGLLTSYLLFLLFV